MKLFYSYLQRNIFGLVSITLTTSLFLQMLNIASGILTARLLEPSGKGELTAVILWPSIIAALGSLGLAGSITYYTSQKIKDSRYIFATSFTIGIIQSIILIIIGFFIIPKVLEEYSKESIQIACVYLLYIPLNLLTLYPLSILAGKLMFGAYNIIRCIFGVSTLVLLFALFIFGIFTVQNVVLMYLMSNFITLCIAYIYIRNSGDLNFKPKLYLTRPLLTYGIKSHLSNISLSLNERLDQLLMSVILLSTDLGLYVVAVTLSTPIVLIGTSIANVAFPAIASSSNDKEMSLKFGRYARFTLWLSVTVACVMLLLSSTLIEVIFGRAYLPALYVAQILLIAAIPLSINRVFQAGLKALNEPLIAGIAETIAVIITVLLLLIYLPKFGIIAAGWVSLIAYSISLLYMIKHFIKKYRISLRDMVLPSKDDIKLLHDSRH